MKKQILIFICACSLCINFINAQSANQQLSNLSGTVAVNLSLIPGLNNSIDLGSSSFLWKYLYIGTNAYFSQRTTDAFIYYNGNKFINTVGGNNQSLYVGELAGDKANATAEINNGCVGVGYQSLNTLGTGWTSGSDGLGIGNHNTAVGWRSLINLNGFTNVGGSGFLADKNTMVGSKSGEYITYGRENTGLGWNVFYRNTATPNDIIGVGNVGVGGAYTVSGSNSNGVLGSLTSGNYNTVVGHSSGYSINSGSNNSIFGRYAGISITTGSDNTIFGESAGITLVSGSDNIFIGSGSDAFLGTGTSNQLNIGNTIYGDLANDKISIGKSSAAPTSTFNVGTTDQFQVNSNGIIPQYKNISTIGNGVPAEYAEVNLTGQTASIGTTTIYTTPSTEGGMYRINYMIKITNTTASTSIVKIQFKYTDNDDNVEVTLPANDINGINQLQTNSTTTGYIGGCYIVNAKGNTAIKYLTSHADAGGTMTYSVHIVVEKL